MSNAPKDQIEANAFKAFETWCKNDKLPGNKSRLDDSDNQNWYSLSLGFFAALNLPEEACHRLSLHARYDHQYWP